jgi:SdpI/YfhL protein family
VPPTLRLILGAVLVAVGAVLVVTAVLGARSRLRRNRWVGVRTAATLASDAAFTAANRAGALPSGAAGVIALAGGAALLGGTAGALGWVLLAISVVGTGVLAGVGGLVGDRAAAGVVPPSPFSAACAGTCAGCDLVAGCRPTAAE